MRSFLIGFAVVGMLVGLPSASAVAQQAPARLAAAQSVRGNLVSINNQAVIVARPSGNVRIEMQPSTQRIGALEVGAPVIVTARAKGNGLTAIRVEPAAKK